MAGVADFFVRDLTVVLTSSAVGGFIANRLKQPVLLGYLLSGFIIGRFGLGLIDKVDSIKPLAEIGVAFLLFALGVEFSLTELKRVKDIALGGSLLQIGLTAILVSVIAWISSLVGSFTEGIFLGAILSLSSTAVVLKTLTERGETNTVHGQIMLTILIVQDLALGLMLAILPALNEPDNLAPALTIAILKAIIFFTSAFAVGHWLIPPLMRNIVQTENSELFLLTVIALCLGVALITAKLGLSIEMGAFVAGLMIAEIDYSDQALAKVIPLRDTFASLFFASIGMLIDPNILLDNFLIIILLVALVMLGKALVIFPIIWKFGYSFKTAIITALGLNQIGEFSFILALEGFKLGFLSERQYLLLIATTAITLVLTPFNLKFAPQIAEQLTKIPWLNKYLRDRQNSKAIAPPSIMSGHVVVAGYGRVGQVIVKILTGSEEFNRSIDRQDNNITYPVLVIENSEAAVKRLRQEGIPYIFGDADSELVLEKAYLQNAKALAIALPDPASTRILLKHALLFAPHLDIVVRSHTNKEIDFLTKMGAKEVVQPEFEAALEMGSHILTTLGEKASDVNSIICEIRDSRYFQIRSDINSHE